MLSLISNLGLLFVFKYLKLFLPDIDAMQANIYTVDHPIQGLLVQGIYFSIPVGISFYTFQTLSYTIDVYFRRVEPETHLGKFALFVTFFPQLVAGPIERFSRLMPQLKLEHSATYENFKNAFRLMLYGFFIKLCIADNLAPLVDQVYANPGNFARLDAWLGTLAFGFQIYADFAGYSLIAQGAALCLGIHLMDNFRTPYLSTSIGEFWSRWHISLSTWFRDYLYIPLGGNRVKVFRWGVNIMLVFIISGFWHGANYTFLIWGGIHGLLYLIERVSQSVAKRLFALSNPSPLAQILCSALKFLPGTEGKSTLANKLVRGLLIFVAVNLAWVFFRIDSMDQVGTHFTALWSSAGTQTLDLTWVLATLMIVFIVFDIALYNNRIDGFLEKFPLAIRWSVYGILLWCIWAWAGMANHPFIYFQF
jgi:D-alanyl-lipoteichoic acid acyltransferase DltB (MBOAT superfamily)